MNDGFFCDEDRKRLNDIGQRLWKPDFKAKTLFLDGVFPTETEYGASLWADWERRIQEGQKAEDEFHKKRLAERVQASQLAIDSDEYWECATEGLCRPLIVSSAMCAAFIVSVWASVEQTLRRLLAVAFLSLDENGQPGRDFKDIKNQFQQHLSILLEKARSYNNVNGVRIVNNCFKHRNDGYDDDPNRPHEQIDPMLLQEWAITNGHAIDYTGLPLKDIVVASHDFCAELFEDTDAFVRDQLLRQQ